MGFSPSNCWIFYICFERVDQSNLRARRSSNSRTAKTRHYGKVVCCIINKKNIDESALQAVFQQYSGHLQHLAVFSTDNIDDLTRLQEGPTNTFPIDYSQAAVVIGEKGKITEPITPNDYDIGTVAMANNQWIVQYEYKESYLKTVENAHQIKYYSPSNWIVFQLPIVFIIITVFILGNWLFQKRITKPVKNILN